MLFIFLEMYIASKRDAARNWWMVTAQASDDETTVMEPKDLDNAVLDLGESKKKVASFQYDSRHPIKAQSVVR